MSDIVAKFEIDITIDSKYNEFVLVGRAIEGDIFKGDSFEIFHNGAKEFIKIKNIGFVNTGTLNTQTLGLTLSGKSPKTKAYYNSLNLKGKILEIKKNTNDKD